MCAGHCKIVISAGNRLLSVFTGSSVYVAILSRDPQKGMWSLIS